MNLAVTLIAFILLIIFIYLYFNERKKTGGWELPEAEVKSILEQEVVFYRKLSETDKAVFIRRVEGFLKDTAINGVGTEVTDADKILVAASAIIPIFSFPDWRYRNIQEVLIYKNAFDKSYSQTEGERNVLGMVGDGAMNNTMILWQEALRRGFDRNEGKNTAIHEFAHLLDKADGSVDGVPEYLMDKQHAVPWLKRIRQEIKNIRNGKADDADINVYAATNEAEFFAVITEYFFEKPWQLKEHHPKLYEDLERIFRA